MIPGSLSPKTHARALSDLRQTGCQNHLRDALAIAMQHTLSEIERQYARDCAQYGQQDHPAGPSRDVAHPRGRHGTTQRPTDQLGKKGRPQADIGARDPVIVD